MMTGRCTMWPLQLNGSLGDQAQCTPFPKEPAGTQECGWGLSITGPGTLSLKPQLNRPGAPFRLSHPYASAPGSPSPSLPALASALCPTQPGLGCLEDTRLPRAPCPGVRYDWSLPGASCRVLPASGTDRETNQNTCSSQLTDSIQFHKY